MFQKRSLSLFILIPLLLVTAACAGLFGPKQAATPAEQALMDTGEKLKEISAESVTTNAAYTKMCAGPRRISAPTCDEWVLYLPTFTKNYADIDADWRTARRNGNVALERDAAARADALAARLKTFTDKTK